LVIGGPREIGVAAVPGSSFLCRTGDKSDSVPILPKRDKTHYAAAGERLMRLREAWLINPLPVNGTSSTKDSRKVLNRA